MLVLAFSQCSKDGPVGPEGPRGEKGEKGDKGDKGNPGTANVFYSDWKTITSDDWEKPTRRHWKYTLNAPKVTKEIMNTGDVRVYIKYSTIVQMLPFNDLPQKDGTEVNIDYLLNESSPGKIFLRAYRQDRDLSLINLQFRYVVIPGGTQALREKGVNIEDYIQVQQYFGFSN